MNESSAMDRVFPVICMAWPALAGRRSSAAASLRSRVERLCALGVDVAVLAPSDVGVVDARLRARPGVEGRLFYLLSHGSEVYSVGPGGPRLIERRLANDRESRELGAGAEAARAALEERGLRVSLKSDRFGVRVLDLMPPQRGAGPRRPGALDTALYDHGIDGLGEALALIRAAARGAGLAHPVLSTDGRRVRFGLTSLGDAARWVAQHLVAKRSRTPEDVLVLADRFGRADGIEPPDQRLRVPELAGALFVALGRDGTVPDDVVQLGGGAARGLAMLDAQIELRERVAREGFPKLTEEPGWLFRVEGFDPFREREVETWLTIANGQSGTRGSLEEGSAASTPATFVAGVFGDGTREPRIREPVPAPDWLCLRLRVNGGLLTLANGEIVEHHRTLDMKQGLVFRDWRQRDRTGRLVHVRTVRFASLDDRALMAVRAEASLEEGAGLLVWEGCLGVSHAGGAVQEAAVESLAAPGVLALTKGRNGGGHGLAAVTLPSPGSPVVRRVQQSRDMIGGYVEAGEPATIDRLAAVVAARTTAPSPVVVRTAVARAQKAGFDELLQRHRDAWARRWDSSDVTIEGDEESQLAVRFATYHMISSADPHNDRVSIGARGLSGMSYYLHVFWDTELFVVPFFIYSWPEAARTLLTYRYRMLPGARQKAHMMGHKGALYPWESADTGAETTPPYGIGPGGEKIPILSGFMEHHISADVAWAVWEYWRATGDDRFMAEMGVEIMLETARFWAARASRDERGRYHIRLVVGPDEYHEGVDDNAFTNVMARWNIERALEAVEWLQEHDAEAASELRLRLGLRAPEVRSWSTVAEHLVDGYDAQTRLYEQFEGFYQLNDLDPSLLQPKPLPADLLLGRELTAASKVVKQSDVVMLCHLLMEDLEPDVVRANYSYYEPITVHGSSLSAGTHAAVAARAGLMERAMEDFRLACAIDLADNMGNAARGLHLATMGGIWQAVVMGFAGVRRRGTALSVDPHLPVAWRRLAFPLRFRGSRLRLCFTPQAFDMVVEGAPLRLILGVGEHRLEPGKHRFRRCLDGSWEADQ